MELGIELVLGTELDVGGLHPGEAVTVDGIAHV